MSLNLGGVGLGVGELLAGYHGVLVFHDPVDWIECMGSRLTTKLTRKSNSKSKQTFKWFYSFRFTFLVKTSDKKHF